MTVDLAECVDGQRWLWAAREGTECVGWLAAVRLPGSPDAYPPCPEPVLCALQVVPGWRWTGLEERLLGRLAEQLTGLGALEVVTLCEPGMEAEYLRQWGAHPLVRSVKLMRVPLDHLSPG